MKHRSYLISLLSLSLLLTSCGKNIYRFDNHPLREMFLSETAKVNEENDGSKTYYFIRSVIEETDSPFTPTVYYCSLNDRTLVHYVKCEKAIPETSERFCGVAAFRWGDFKSGDFVGQYYLKDNHWYISYRDLLKYENGSIAYNNQFKDIEATIYRDEQKREIPSKCFALAKRAVDNMMEIVHSFNPELTLY